MNTYVALYPLKAGQRYSVKPIDLVVYLKKYGEHLLAVKVVKLRKGELNWAEIGVEIMEVIHFNQDTLTNCEADSDYV